MRKFSESLAFPQSDGIYEQHGLTKRELFAAMAMQGMCGAEIPRVDQLAQAAQLSVAMADALLAELAKEPT
jgi:hypothetical protein